MVYELISPATSAVNNGNNNTFTGLAPGTYMFRVTDNDGCSYDESYTIAPVTEISVTGQLVNNITCFGNSDGELQYTVNNFNSDYDYTVTGPDNFSGTNETNSTISLTGLAEGTYTITVTDSTLSAAEVVALDAKTVGDITINAATTLNGTIDDLTAIYAGGAANSGIVNATESEVLNVTDTVVDTAKLKVLGTDAGPGTSGAINLTKKGIKISVIKTKKSKPKNIKLNTSLANFFDLDLFFTNSEV